MRRGKAHSLEQINVLAARTQDELEIKGADVADVHFEAVAEAKKRAKYLLTEAFRRPVSRQIGLDIHRY